MAKTLDVQHGHEECGSRASIAVAFGKVDMQAAPVKTKYRGRPDSKRCSNSILSPRTRTLVLTFSLC